MGVVEWGAGIPWDGELGGVCMRVCGFVYARVCVRRAVRLEACVRVGGGEAKQMCEVRILSILLWLFDPMQAHALPARDPADQEPPHLVYIRLHLL